MKERLSRMERYSRQQPKIRALQDTSPKDIDNLPKLTRSQRIVNKEQTIRKEKQALSRKSAGALHELQSAYQESAVTTDEALLADDMPSRREVFPSQRLKWTRWFFNSLVFIFIALLILLFFWGMQHSVWGVNALQQKNNSPK
ncbi:hypothetical protein J2Z69_000530 [Paenibacillus shirakamiensis]|uniref:Uncharacterized protein n=1 Tax=Paenibacillus shirakamiensis TaxID=1265935 RepID=A0ABS4JEX3_9BACL|nr:hypothetical protein [Paenibacillus shirakamiensis]MBP1999511.1 hypothetical protein [Paenibacillus shirakamiensis]